jgi:hypothetical protein
MNTKTKLKKLISRSILISPEKRIFLSTLEDSLSEEKILQLIQILETEQGNVSKIIKNNFSSGPNSELLKKFDEFFRRDSKESLVEMEDEDHVKDENQLDELDKMLTI